MTLAAVPAAEHPYASPTDGQSNTTYPRLSPDLWSTAAAHLMQLALPPLPPHLQPPQQPQLASLRLPPRPTHQQQQQLLPALLPLLELLLPQHFLMPPPPQLRPVSSDSGCVCTECLSCRIHCMS
jgi:hypothetical protein